MAQEYALEIYGQPTRYSDRARKFHIYFAEPDAGVNEGTGILLLIAGYGGNAHSRVYQKMRKVLADQYNLVTLQCDYLGWQFMKNDQHLQITEKMLRQVLSPREFRTLEKDYAGNRALLRGKVLSGEIPLQETAEDFNEMGMWQAMDHLVALRVLQGILRENALDWDAGRVYLYGQSHGAYLCYLCNRMAPGVFAGLIDQSAYLTPYYLDRDRTVTAQGEWFDVERRYHYLISDQDIDWQSYQLPYLYHGFVNRAKIVCYHGADDEMIPLEEKRRFLQGLQQVHLHVVSEAEVDGELFSSAGHDLGADFLKLFDLEIQEMEGNQWENDQQRHDEELQTEMAAEQMAFRVQTARYTYWIEEVKGMPVLRVKGSESDERAV